MSLWDILIRPLNLRVNRTVLVCCQKGLYWTLLFIKLTHSNSLGWRCNKMLVVVLKTWLRKINIFKLLIVVLNLNETHVLNCWYPVMSHSSLNETMMKTSLRFIAVRDRRIKQYTRWNESLCERNCAGSSDRWWNIYFEKWPKISQVILQSRPRYVYTCTCVHWPDFLSCLGFLNKYVHPSYPYPCPFIVHSQYVKLCYRRQFWNFGKQRKSSAGLFCGRSLVETSRRFVMFNKLQSTPLISNPSLYGAAQTIELSYFVKVLS